jgi:hypothetical protein
MQNLLHINIKGAILSSIYYGLIKWSWQCARPYRFSIEQVLGFMLASACAPGRQHPANISEEERLWWNQRNWTGRIKPWSHTRCYLVPNLVKHANSRTWSVYKGIVRNRGSIYQIAPSTTSASISLFLNQILLLQEKRNKTGWLFTYKMQSKWINS